MIDSKSTLGPFDYITALDEIEFKKKLDKIVCNHLVNTDPRFKDATYEEPDDGELKNKHLNVNGFSNYNEMLEDALFLSNIFGKRAYELENGRLHISMSRISIVLSITAAEDYANFILLTKLNRSKRSIENLDLIKKWEILIPDVKDKFPDFLFIKKLRNNSIVHYKSHKKFILKEILNLNYKNGVKAAKTVLRMIKEYEQLEEERIRFYNSACILLGIINISKEISVKMNSRK